MFVKLLKSCTTILFICFLSGCVTTASSTDVPIPPIDMANADFGKYPDNYESSIKQWVVTNFKDPDSARYVRITTPRKEYMIANLKPFYGYSTCLVVNAKNSYGGYTGNQIYWFMFHDGKIVRSQRVDSGFPGPRISLGHNVNCE